jgi:hypothetical protein
VGEEPRTIRPQGSLYKSFNTLWEKQCRKLPFYFLATPCVAGGPELPKAGGRPQLGGHRPLQDSTTGGGPKQTQSYYKSDKCFGLFSKC